VGFGNLDTLRLCRFLPMATNRCISQDVVAQRVGENLARLRERKPYLHFGQVIRADLGLIARWPCRRRAGAGACLLCRAAGLGMCR
jgi:hypothetical protein